jgi:dienelactone hydrolase
MVPNRIYILLLSIGVAPFSSGQALDYKGFPEWSWGKKDSSEYYLYTPSNLEPGKRYPVVLFMHGCCGQDYHATLRNAVDPPVRMWHNFGANTQRIPTYIISAKTKVGWRQHFENLKSVIDELIDNHQGDPQRIYVSGFSMGGGGTWEILEKYPGFFAAALPMGMDFRGKDPAKFTTIPIWTNRGENDWWSRHLGAQMADIRKLNGGPADSSNWVTGVNPRMTTFEGVGHGVMWSAASTQDLVGWAYTKVNDGNNYPTVFFESPSYKSTVDRGSMVPVSIHATDVDGSIAHVDVYVNEKLHQSLTKTPYSTSVRAGDGDLKITAIAFDDKGKTASQSLLLRVPIPATLTPGSIEVKQGELCNLKLQATGNGALSFRVSGNSPLAPGLTLNRDGTMYGIATVTGSYKPQITVSDDDGDTDVGNILLHVLPKNQDEVIVTRVRDYNGIPFPISKVGYGVTPHYGPADGEVTFSGGLDPYEGLTLIQTDKMDTINASSYYLEFQVDEDVMVYVAYEKKDKLFTSTVPDWLKSFKKESNGQIVTQYFYYDVYSKRFPKGRVAIPDAGEQQNGVSTNYFVMVKKATRN